MGSPAHPHGRGPLLRHRVEHLLFVRLLEGCARRPLEEALGRGARLGRLWHRLDRRHRRLAEENIRLGLGLDPAAAARTARETFEHLGRTLAEFAVAARRPGELLSGFTVEGLERLREAAAAGRGVFLLSGHCGNWELLGARIAREIPLTNLARAMSNPLVDADIRARRASAGVRTLDARDATRGILRLLRGGEAVGVLLDQSALRRERVFVPFLGRPASTSFGLAMLAIKTGAPVLPVFGVREPGGAHRAWIDDPIAPAEEGTREERIGVTTARYTAAIEGFVRRHPAQWFWVHDRWRRRPEAQDRVWQP